MSNKQIELSRDRDLARRLKMALRSPIALDVARGPAVFIRDARRVVGVVAEDELSERERRILAECRAVTGEVR